MCLWFIISGVQKMKQIKSSQEQAALDKEEEKALSNEEEQNTTDQ